MHYESGLPVLIANYPCLLPVVECCLCVCQCLLGADLILFEQQVSQGLRIEIGQLLRLTPEISGSGVHRDHLVEVDQFHTLAHQDILVSQKAQPKSLFCFHALQHLMIRQIVFLYSQSSAGRKGNRHCHNRPRVSSLRCPRRFSMRTTTPTISVGVQVSSPCRLPSPISTRLFPASSIRSTRCSTYRPPADCANTMSPRLAARVIRRSTTLSLPPSIHGRILSP